MVLPTFFIGVIFKYDNLYFMIECMILDYFVLNLLCNQDE